MKQIRIVLLALGLAGCANVQAAYQSLTGASVPPGAVIVSGYSVDALETTATQYLTRPRCGTPNVVICRSPSVTAILIPAVKDLRTARNAAEDFLASHPTALGSQGVYDAVKAAAATLKGILDKSAITVGG